MKEMPHSLQMVTRKRSGRKAATRMLILLICAGLALGFVPWQQTIAGSGEIFVFAAMDRPQPIEAQIPGRIVAWNVQEGQTVRRGQAIARLEDLDSKFLDAGQVKRMREQRTFAVETQEDSRQRVTELLAQKADLSEARRNALLAGEQAILQAEQRQRASGQAVRAAETALVATRNVALLSADERKSQATDRIAQAEQAVRAAEGQEATMRAIRDRAQRLFDKGLRAKQDLEIAENNLVKAETDTEARRSSLEIAKRDLTVGGLARDGAELDIVRAEAALETARANFAVAERDVTNARLGLNRLRAETAAALA
ncbi:biotin/lipoyl-binding protein, partial [bacterium]